MAPARWYELHIVSPEQDVAGHVDSRVPFVVARKKTSTIAWGITMPMMMMTPIFISNKFDSIQRPAKYMFNRQLAAGTEDIDYDLRQGWFRHIFFRLYKRIMVRLSIKWNRVRHLPVRLSPCAGPATRSSNEAGTFLSY